MSQEDKKKLPVVEIIDRIVNDEDYRRKFLENPSAALNGVELTDTQREVLEELTEQDIEFLKDKNIEELYLAESAVYMPSAEDEDGQVFDYLSDEYDLQDFGNEDTGQQ